MSTLERRMNKLERAEIGGAELLEAIIVSGMSTGSNKPVSASFGDQVVDRRADEAEDDFIERATAEALAATGQRPCLVFLFSEKVPQ